MNNHSMYSLSLIVEGLRSIDPVHLANERKGYGICWALNTAVAGLALLAPESSQVLDHTSDVWYAEKDAILRRWDKFSGDTVHPVPSDDPEYCPGEAYVAYHYRGTLWCGRQGELRRELLAHLIQGFERLLLEAADAAKEQRQEAL